MRTPGPRRRMVALLPIFIALWVVFISSNSRRERASERPPAPAPPAATVPAPDAAPGAARGFDASVGFRSEQRLDEHFEKHGREFDARSAAEYLALAQALRDRPAGGEVRELVRDDGVTCRFDRATGAFLAFNRDGTIRTFFKPNDGERYFERQSERAP